MAAGYLICYFIVWQLFDAVDARVGARGRLVLVDVRSQPGSGRAPHFKKGSLEAECKRRSVRYEWQGSNLGGLPAPKRSPLATADALARLARRVHAGDTALGHFVPSFALSGPSLFNMYNYDTHVHL